MSHGNSRQVAHATDGNASVTFASETRDTPYIPIEDFERAYKINPAFGDKLYADVIAMAKEEGLRRRTRMDRLNFYVFIERVSGQVFGLLALATLVGGGVYCITTGHDWAGAGFVTGGIAAGVAAIFVQGRSTNK